MFVEMISRMDLETRLWILAALSPIILVLLSSFLAYIANRLGPESNFGSFINKFDLMIINLAAIIAFIEVVAGIAWFLML